MYSFSSPPSEVNRVVSSAVAVLAFRSISDRNEHPGTLVAARSLRSFQR